MLWGFKAISHSIGSHCEVYEAVRLVVVENVHLLLVQVALIGYCTFEGSYSSCPLGVLLSKMSTDQDLVKW